MSRQSPKLCDHQSVGVNIWNRQDAVALLRRARHPEGMMAPPSGHIDKHGSPVQAAVTEVREELGIRIPIKALRPTIIQGRMVKNNRCPRIGGDHHKWWVYEANEFEGVLRPSPVETQGAGWYTRKQLQELANRTRAFLAGKIPPAEWAANPGLEPVWIGFFVELDYIK